ncbi:MAG: S8 family serine peptidase [Bacteroidetes bacterium]|nr:S8 family serine peptidase [Bacteroidota bacterium]
MIRSILILTLLYSSTYSQTLNYWVQFTDKDNTPYTINDPSAFLSSRAIERREANNIPIIENDLPVDPVYIDSVRATGAKVLHRSKWFNSVTVEFEDSGILNQIQALGFVRKTELTYIDLSGKKGLTPSKFEELHSLTEISDSTYYGSAFRQISMLNGDWLHFMGFDGKGMVIAVIDNGFNQVDVRSVFDSLIADHFLGSWDFVENKENVFETNFSHGTTVVSTMAANTPERMVGTAPGADYWLLRSEAPMENLVEEDNWTAAAEFADSVGADIINSSLAYTTFDTSIMDHTYADMDGNTTRVTRAADIAASKGILVVNSAGNFGNGSWRYMRIEFDAVVVGPGAVQIGTGFSS